MGKDELIKSLQEINDKRLLSSEVTALLAPFKEAAFSLSLEFISHSRTFGKQKDPVYNAGQTGIFKFTDMDIECAVLFAPEDSQMVEKQKEGERSEFLVRYFDYDSLYQRIIVGKVSPGTENKNEGADGAGDSVQESTSEVAHQGVTESIAIRPEIETPQGVNKVITGSESPAKDSSTKFKKKKKSLSFPRAQFHIQADQKRNWIAERSAQEDIKERQFRNAIGPILISVGIIFCLDGCVDGLGAGFFIGVFLLAFGLTVRLNNKSK